MILGENAARLYGVDIAALQVISDEVGPTIEEVLVSASDSVVDDLLSTATSTGRKLAAAQFAR